MAHMKRLVGSGFWNKLGNALGKVKDFFLRPEVRNVVKGLARESGVPELGKAANVAERLGYGVSGGARSGGRRNANLSELM